MFAHFGNSLWSNLPREGHAQKQRLKTWERFSTAGALSRERARLSEEGEYLASHHIHEAGWGVIPAM